MTVLSGDDERPGVFGAQTLNELPDLVEQWGLRRLLVVTGKASFEASGAAAVLPALRRVAAVETWSDFDTNPALDDVVDGTRIAQAFAPDAVVGIGGGSVLDMAKLLSVYAESHPEDIRSAVEANRVEGRSPRLILVPTTSGSGSEATHFAVVYIGQEKFSVADPSMLPDFVILDPVLTESASPYQKATSVIDAIAQAVESLWARNATPASQAFARDALVDLVPAAASFVSGDSPAAVLAARGSHLAGRAIDLSKTTGPHAMAYGLTKRHGVSHGHAVATTLGAFARLHASSPAASADSALARSMDAIAEAIGAQGRHGVGDRLDQLAADLGLELRLEALGVPREDLAVMAGGVNQERLANNPVDINESELIHLLGSCW